jgi:hypothetical protein
LECPRRLEIAAAYAFHTARISPSSTAQAQRIGGGSDLLRLYGLSVADPNERLYDAMIALATHQLYKPGLASLLRELAE